MWANFESYLFDNLTYWNRRRFLELCMRFCMRFGAAHVRYNIYICRIYKDKLSEISLNCSYLYEYRTLNPTSNHIQGPHPEKLYSVQKALLSPINKSHTGVKSHTNCIHKSRKRTLYRNGVRTKASPIYVAYILL